MKSRGRHNSRSRSRSRSKDRKYSRSREDRHETRDDRRDDRNYKDDKSHRDRHNSSRDDDRNRDAVSKDDRYRGSGSGAGNRDSRGGGNNNYSRDSRDTRNGDKPSNEGRKTDEKSLEETELNSKEDDIIDEATLRDLEKFAADDGVDDEEETERLVMERKRRREEILKQHQTKTSISINSEVTASASLYLEDVVSSNMPATSHTDNGPEVNDSFDANANTIRKSERDTIEELAAERDALEAEARKDNAIAFDIFSKSPTDRDITGKTGHRRALKAALQEGEDPYLESNWDDGEGYYKPRVGEVIADRYVTRGVVGKGVFSVVLSCSDLRLENTTVAIKMIRNNDTMRKAAEKEISILSQIKDNDLENKKYCIRLLNHMEYRNHVTMVFEPMQMNLRDTIKKFGKNVGINISAVRMYAKQLLVALKHLSDLRIVHADIKPDNILVSDDLKYVKLCDFGSAFRETDTDNDPTPYLVSRFYRAPEVILGLLYDKNVDLWSIGTCLYELFTGHVMFPGRTNNDMLRLFMDVKGRFPNKLLRQHLRAYESMAMDTHFQEDLRFKQYEQDPVTGKAVMRVVDITTPHKDLSAILLSSKAGADDRKLVSQLADLLDKILALDPARRPPIMEALRHQFFSK